MIKTTFKDIQYHLSEDLNLKSDDIVFLFSGIWGLGQLENNDANIVIEAFKKTLNKGIIIVPTFSYSWNNNNSWFIQDINCKEMGTISCNTINKDNFFRTDHPNFSVNIFKNKYNNYEVDDLLDIDLDTFGESSIFGKLYKISKKRRAFVLVFGGAFDDVLYRSTFIHYAQQKIGVSHRYKKKIFSPNKKHYVLQYSRYLKSSEVRNNELKKIFNFPIEEDFTLYGHELLKKNLLIKKNFKFYPSRMVVIHKSVDFMINRYKQNKFYCINSQSIK